MHYTDPGWTRHQVLQRNEVSRRHLDEGGRTERGSKARNGRLSEFIFQEWYIWCVSQRFCGTVRNSAMLLFLVRVRMRERLQPLHSFNLCVVSCLFPSCSFLALRAVGCKISPLILKQWGATEAELLLGVLATLQSWFMGCNVMDGQEMLRAFWHAPAQTPAVYLNPCVVTVEIITEAVYLFGFYGKRIN